MMAMTDYLTEIEYAASHLIPMIWSERETLRKLQATITDLGKVVKFNYQRAELLQRDAEDPEDVAMGAGLYWATYFDEDKELYHKKEEHTKVNNQIVTHTFSVASLAGSLLQHAKQGISLTHGGLVNCPNGRLIGTQHLKDVVWQGRNQAIHWEEGNPHSAVRRCFDTLAQDVDQKFAAYTSQNMAFDIVELLRWTDFDAFKTDMLLLA